jgi:hypothetical protein
MNPPTAVAFEAAPVSLADALLAHSYDAVKPAALRTTAAANFTGGFSSRVGLTGLDYFGARYLSGAQGRFTSVDRPC